MKADYKNWMPKGMINGFCSASVVCLVALWIIEFFKIILFKIINTDNDKFIIYLFNLNNSFKIKPF